jgi:hypothetical protein
MMRFFWKGVDKQDSFKVLARIDVYQVARYLLSRFKGMQKHFLHRV